jgi:hypothetical protein
VGPPLPGRKGLWELGAQDIRFASILHRLILPVNSCLPGDDTYHTAKNAKDDKDTQVFFFALFAVKTKLAQASPFGVWAIASCLAT